MTARTESGAAVWRLVLAGLVLAVIAGIALVAFTPVAGARQPLGQGEAAGHDHTAVATTEPTTGSDGFEVGTPLDPSAAVPSTVGTSGEATLAAAAALGTAPRDMTTQGGERGDVAPDAILSGQSTSLGGCATEYGTTGQCLPTVPPSMAAHVRDMTAAGIDPSTMPHMWTCGELLQYFPQGIAVRVPGVDPYLLDRSDDGVACGEGD